ncbi:hypothetical protein VB738_12740 [Cyanobium gracile UHCC 0139]|uniref:Uncharacterized protein n=1 Tax=Cyanobium gracile UHCC 0139 TaxID=3110308 RepID=A0ABU5RWG9_9CYAN|nr:hypothetical protein [Cyanobium gracile]MEA5392126.1 hypothetical protein [Cyanobium gracile UHCC 0139]
MDSCSARRTLPDLLTATTDAIDGENLDIDRLELLRRVNDGRLQPEDELKAVDYLLSGIIGLADQVRMHL